MRMAIGLEAGRANLKSAIDEICEVYDLKRIPLPTLFLPNEDKAIFFAESDDLKKIDALQSDGNIEGLWFDPELLDEVSDEPTACGDMDTVLRLNKLLKK